MRLSCRASLSALLASLVLVEATDSTLERYVVTDVRMVQAPSRDAALELCQRDGLSVTTGVDWTNGVHLCQRRMKIHDVKLDQQVVTQLAVYTSTTSCPSGSTLLHSPRPNVVVCVSTGEASTWIASGNYVSDVSVTQERNYNNDDMALGWTTSPINLKDEPKPSNSGVFLSVRRPARGFSKLQIVKTPSGTPVGSACASALGESWRQAGNGFIETGDSKTTLCGLVRSSMDETPNQLVDIALTRSNEECPEGFSRSTALSDSFRVCSQWSTSASRFVTDIDLHAIDPVYEGQDISSPEFLPGKFELLSRENVNPRSTPVYLFKRRASTDTAAPTSSPNKPPIQAVADGSSGSLSFKVLQLADLHYTGNSSKDCRDSPAGMPNCNENVMTGFVNQLLDIERPDFVVFSGDNVETFSSSLRRVAMDAATAGVEARKIPYAMIFGNHDDENGFSREEIVKIAMSKPYSYTQRGPTEVDGVGNYEIGVQAPRDGPWGAKGKEVFRMYFLDSHAYPDKSKYPLVTSTYDWVKTSQIKYYRQLSALHRSQNNLVPSVMFFHIPLIEYASNAKSRVRGAQNEGVASSKVNTNLFSTLVDLNEVKATFVGHDHVNEYCYLREGIQLCYGGGAGFGQAYGDKDFPRRARVIEWSQNAATGKRTLRSWKRHYGDLSARKNEEVLFSEG
ncbi:hypothetical protein PINS_up020624 [Pythium insidiosum]|nr:hypothetical protein PINS_up020624 [Pythium insidiosum]